MPVCSYIKKGSMRSLLLEASDTHALIDFYNLKFETIKIENRGYNEMVTIKLLSGYCNYRSHLMSNETVSKPLPETLTLNGYTLTENCWDNKWTYVPENLLPEWKDWKTWNFDIHIEDGEIKEIITIPDNNFYDYGAFI